MKRRNLFPILLFILGLIFIVLLAIPAQPSKPSEAARAALVYLAKAKNIPGASLAVAAERPKTYENLGRQFQVVTLYDTRPGGLIYVLLVDLDSGEIIEDVDAVWAENGNAHPEKYSELMSDLFERLQARETLEH